MIYSADARQGCECRTNFAASKAPLFMLRERFANCFTFRSAFPLSFRDILKLDQEKTKSKIQEKITLKNEAAQIELAKRKLLEK